MWLFSIILYITNENIIQIATWILENIFPISLRTQAWVFLWLCQFDTIFFADFSPNIWTRKEDSYSMWKGLLPLQSGKAEISPSPCDEMNSWNCEEIPFWPHAHKQLTYFLKKCNFDAESCIDTEMIGGHKMINWF